MGDQFAEMCIAGREFTECIANANNWAAIKCVIRQAIVLHPTAMDETVLVLAPEPRLRPEFFHLLSSFDAHSTVLPGCRQDGWPQPPSLACE
jgi:hypothetical protein